VKEQEKTLKIKYQIIIKQIIENLFYLYYNFSDFKKELIQMNEEKGFNKTVINCLSMIYLTPLTNPYKTREN